MRYYYFLTNYIYRYLYLQDTLTILYYNVSGRNRSFLKATCLNESVLNSEILLSGHAIYRYNQNYNNGTFANVVGVFIAVRASFISQIYE